MAQGPVRYIRRPTDPGTPGPRDIPDLGTSSRSPSHALTLVLCKGGRFAHDVAQVPQPLFCDACRPLVSTSDQRRASVRAALNAATWAAPRREFGVTAFSEEDALAILAHVVFPGQAMPDVLEVRADVDVRDLDQGHVIPNMGPPNWRGICYPKGFDTDIR